jgi:hypothetical protein
MSKNTNIYGVLVRKMIIFKSNQPYDWNIYLNIFYLLHINKYIYENNVMIFFYY